MSVLGTIVGGAVQAGLGAINNVWAQEQQREARRENYIYGEMAAKNADARTRALYNDFYSTEALMKQYKAAGLSPSMMFGGTPGQGGMSGAQGTGAAGPGALYTPISMLEGAQIANINAQTEKTKAETANIEEDTTLKKFEQTTKELENYILDKSKEFQINQYNALAERTWEEYSILVFDKVQHQAEADVAIQTVDDRIKAVKIENDLNRAKEALLKSQKGLTEKQAEQIVQSMKYQIKYFRLAEQELNNKLAQTKNQEEAIKITKEWYETQKKNFENRLNLDWEKFKVDTAIRSAEAAASIVDSIIPF